MVQIDRASRVPIYLQLEEGIRLGIRRGELSPGQSLPTVRGLAETVGVNPNTVARVYRELQRDGLLRLERGLGTFVTESAGSGSLSRDQLDAIEGMGREWVALAGRAGMTPAELGRLLDALWKGDFDD